MEVPLYELTIILLIVLFGGMSAFFSSLITEIPQEKINEMIEDDYKAAKIFRNLQLQFEQNVSPFQIIEITAYSLAGAIAGYRVIPQVESYTFLLYAAAFTAGLLILRYILQAIGIRLAGLVTPGVSIVLSGIYFIMKPLYLFFSFLTAQIVGSRTEEDSREEIEDAVESAYSEKALAGDEYRILKNTMKFNEITAREVMTPRTVIFGMDIMTPVESIVDNPELQNYSRFPVWEGESIDDGVRGYVMTRDIFYAAVSGKGRSTLDEFVREMRIINETDPLNEVLERFISNKKHMFMVADEYGGITGLITMEDVLESILGEEIVDEVDQIVDMRQLAKQTRDKRITKL